MCNLLCTYSTCTLLNCHFTHSTIIAVCLTLPLPVLTSILSPPSLMSLTPPPASLLPLPSSLRMADSAEATSYLVSTTSLSSASQTQKH